MIEPKKQDPLALIVIELIDDDNILIDFKGKEKQVIRMLSALFGEYPQLIDAFETARRYYERYKAKQN